MICPTHKYLIKFEEVRKQLGMDVKITDFTIYHDRDCSMFQGGFCNCEAEFMLKNHFVKPDAIIAGFSPFVNLHSEGAK